MKIFRTSPSDLSLYASCPYCWWLKHQGHKQQASPAMLFGTRLHSAIANYHKDEELPLLYDDGLQPYLQEYKAVYDREYEVCEEFWQFPLFDTDITLKTKVDLIKDNYLIDHKTSSRPYSQEHIDSQYQVTAYAYSWHQKFSEPEKGIRFNVFNTNPKMGDPLMQILETSRSKEDFEVWEAWVREILKGIEVDYFEVGNGQFHNFFDCPKFNVKGGEFMEQKPSVGRIVHVKGPGDICMAAMIVFVHDGGLVNLAVFNETGMMDASRIKTGGYHWPERV